MEHLSFSYDGGESCDRREAAVGVAVVGVVSSGNLEVMIEPTPTDARCVIDVDTPARGFDAVWAAVLGDFFERTRLGGVRISINDVGATPAVVGLRLDQAVESYRASRR